jgi:LuxR family transcriptional regulator, maltose regulon positive regulatory protein
MGGPIDPGGSQTTHLLPPRAFNEVPAGRRGAANDLPRKRLTDALEGAQEAVVLLAAPPGFGKTTLLRQWQAAEKRPFALVTVNPDDNHPVTLWTRVVETIRAVEPGFESESEAALRAPYVELADVALPLLGNDLRRLKKKLVIALDDYQVIQNRKCHESLEVFLRWMPSHVMLVLSSRADPPLPLGTLRAGGDLFELRALDLCFTEDEAASFLNETHGLGLSPQALRTLHEHTEGWPAGVYLASLSLEKAEDRTAFVDAFSGSNRLVVDYLTEVVLDSLDPRRRQFLLETSILDSVCAGLADSVTGRAHSAKLLDDLDRSNVFLVALDDERRSYRYHQLFAELLRSQLLRHQGELVPVLHRRASCWYAEHGYTDAAIRHAVAGDDLTAAVELLVAAWVPTLDSVEARRILGWLEGLGEDAVAADARLSLAWAWAASMTDQPGQAARALESAKGLGLEGTLPDGTSLRAAAAVVEACSSRGDVGAMHAAARRARDLQGDLALSWRPLSCLSLGWAEHLSGNWKEAETSLQAAAAAAIELQQWLHACIAYSLLARIALVKDEHGLAEPRARDALDALRKHARSDPLAAGIAETALGAVLARAGGTAEAGRNLSRGLVHLRTHGDPLLAADALLVAAPVRRKLQSAAKGRSCIAEARELLEGCLDAGVVEERLEDVARTLTPGYRRAGAETELTERELEVLHYLAEGLPKREIGAELFLSYNTIHSHTKSIYQKLRVSSRSEAIEKARALGAL